MVFLFHPFSGTIFEAEGGVNTLRQAKLRLRSSKVEKRILRQKLIRQDGIQRQFGPIVQIAYTIGIGRSVVQFESYVTKPDLYRNKRDNETGQSI